MTQGILIYALNNDKIDYCKIALYAAKQAKKYLKKEVTIVTDSPDYIKSLPDFDKHVDNVINVTYGLDYGDVQEWLPGAMYSPGTNVTYKGRLYWTKKHQIHKKTFNFLEWESDPNQALNFLSKVQHRKHFDGAMSHKRTEFKNDIRTHSFFLTPYDETLVIDCDYIINNDALVHAWDQKAYDFLIYKDSNDLCDWRKDLYFKKISDYTLDFYWATVFWFRKNDQTLTFFHLLQHIEDNWQYYRYLYQIHDTLYRNDFAFSIAIHMMNGYQKTEWNGILPGKMYHVLDQDLLLEHDGTRMKFLLAKEKYYGEYTAMTTDKLNVHVMNKFSINRLLSNE